jgi:hypothetical protein
MSLRRIHIRDAVKFILADMDSFYETSAPSALAKAMRKVRLLSAESLTRLRRRQFGTVPNTNEEALRFLVRKFRELRESFEELENDPIESFGETSSESASDTSSESASDRSSDTESTVSFSSTDSERTVPIDLRY